MLSFPFGEWSDCFVVQRRQKQFLTCSSCHRRRITRLATPFPAGES
jgi:hypothetical protein